MVKKLFVGIVAISSLALPVLGQTNDSIQALKVSSGSQNITKSDTVAWVDDKLLVDKSADKVIKNSIPFKPDPNKAVLYSAIFPGLGQLYNRKYWKLPIVYGGFLGLTYAISWNGRMYNDYTAAYKAIKSDDPRSEANFRIWGPFVRRITDPSKITDSEINTYQNSFKRNRDSYRRYRDLSIIGAVALYGLCMIDAYVDAQLFNFDISPDLSLRVEPQMQTDPFAQRSFGVQCSFKF
uniref:DUF5683 domain-containing protein n=1 Tax=uncultured Dysgonomonas sp. TaxID=206096 RepID=UPI002629C1E6|nr:DUF5683 domain-containing protein [uncultured Dysgonomonas sp.]